MSEKTTLHLPEKYTAQVVALLRQHIPQAEVWAYGSRVRGDHYDASDVDLVARFPATEKSDIFRLSALRESFIESNLPIIVQVIDWERIPSSFRDEILNGYVVVQKGKSVEGSAERPMH